MCRVGITVGMGRHMVNSWIMGVGACGDCGLATADWQLRTGDCGLATADWRLARGRVRVRIRVGVLCHEHVVCGQCPMTM